RLAGDIFHRRLLVPEARQEALGRVKDAVTGRRHRSRADGSHCANAPIPYFGILCSRGPVVSRGSRATVTNEMRVGENDRRTEALFACVLGPGPPEVNSCQAFSRFGPPDRRAHADVPCALRSATPTSAFKQDASRCLSPPAASRAEHEGK